MNVLVTGAAGYVGQHACHALKDAGMTVWGLDLPGKRPVAVADRWVECAVEHLHFQHDVLLHADAVLHLAAEISVAEAEVEPWRYYRANVGHTEKLLDAWHSWIGSGARHGFVRPFVFASSAAVYGGSARGSLSENASCAPTNAYGKSKLHVEHILDDYGRAYGLPWAALRFFNVAGAWPERALGEIHVPETHLIPRLIDAARHDRLFTVFGEQWPTLDGTCERDYVHVRDVADACVAAIRALASGKRVGSINVGSSLGTSVQTAINAVEREVGCRIRKVNEPARAGDVARLVANIAKARDVLDWAPKRSSLDRIVEDAVAFAMLPPREAPTKPAPIEDSV